MAHVVGTGFLGRTATLESGRYDHAFDPADIKDELGRPLFGANGVYGLVASEGTNQSAFFPEIVAVEAADGGYRVHPVRWAVWIPAITDFSFDMLVLPHVAGPVTFLPPAEGSPIDRPTTLRHQARLDLYPGDQPRITP